MPRLVPSFTIQNPTPSSVVVMTLSRQSNGAGGFVTVCNAAYELEDENGNIVVRDAVDLQLSGAQSTAIANFINSHILPLIVSANNL